ncbi:MAG TPA: DNA recombination protein RmuC [Solirubrobacterales bacterium]|nr:DNA recombination protein RmuC [Solirubrobacterales bacterium]
MTVFLAIAVVVLAAGLVYALVSRQAEPSQPDLGPAIQEATSKAVTDLLRMNEEARKLDTKTAEAALDKRQAEIKGLAERIAKGQEKIEQEVRRRGETDLQTRTLLEQMGQTVGNLNSETAGLKKALRQPQTRGQWGELQLRRCVEIAGMTEHVDFELQETLRTVDGNLRPDARFLLPEGRSFIADSKVPLDAFLDAQEAEVESERHVQLERHARQAREHIRSLSSKDYQGQFKAGEMPDLVICFIPNEPALHAAFAADPTLFDYALERNVLVVSPTSLIGLLRTMELGWRQERMVAEAAEIADAAGTLHSRFAKFLSDFNTVGKRLTSATDVYNSAVGSLEGRLLPQLRKVEGLGVAPGKEIEEPTPIEITVRAIEAPELSDSETPVLD